MSGFNSGYIAYVYRYHPYTDLINDSVYRLMVNTTDK